MKETPRITFTLSLNKNPRISGEKGWDELGEGGYTAGSAGIFKLLRSTGIDSKESIPPAYVVWRANTTALFYSYSVPSPHRLF
jgi:hypothetical protein